jgi:hypothetical protein
MAELGAGGLPVDPSEEDAKLIVLARAARARTGAPEGAAVRDTTGRTYAACTVELPSLALTALQAAVAAAVASGATGIEAAAVVGPAPEAAADPGVAAVRDLSGPGVLVHRATSSGEPASTFST